MRETPEATTLLAARYAIGPTLGSGGMGEVRLAWDTRLSRRVAVKTLHPMLAADPHMRRRFETEGRTAAKITHPNVVQVYDCGEDDGVPFLVMEYVEGPTLAAEIARGPIRPERARRIALGAALGLAAAHAQGITHCDVKPANIILVDDEPKVTDFGIAKTVDALSSETTGLLLGTPAYVSPERATGGPAAPTDDVYSTGIMLAEMLTGERSTSVEVDAIDPDLASVIRRATCASPDERFAHGAELAAALAARPRPTERDPTIAVAATATVPIASAPTVATVAMAGVAADTARGRRRLLPVVAVTLAALALVALGVGFGVFDTGNGDAKRPAVEVPEVTTAPTVVTAAPTLPPASVPVVGAGTAPEKGAKKDATGRAPKAKTAPRQTKK